MSTKCALKDCGMTGTHHLRAWAFPRGIKGRSTKATEVTLSRMLCREHAERTTLGEELGGMVWRELKKAFALYGGDPDPATLGWLVQWGKPHSGGTGVLRSRGSFVVNPVAVPKSLGNARGPRT